MVEHINGFKAAVAALAAALTALWGWFGWMVIAWIVAMMLDVLTGFCAACKNGEWSSSVARDGLWHKAGCIFAVLVAALLDIVVGQVIAHIPAITLPFTYTVFLCPMLLVWYILTEAGSITENAGKLGAAVPKWLRKLIAAFRDKVDDSMGGDKEE